MTYVSVVAAAVVAVVPTVVLVPQDDPVTVTKAFRADVRDGAVTYDPDAVPEGARVQVVERETSGGGTRFELRLRGLPGNRTFGAHVHREACGSEPEDAGPHYQHVKDPVQPSVDPAYANPRNEAWLDFTTDRRGDARVEATVTWRVRPGEARSMVLHEHATETARGRAGMAGERLACVTVPFGRGR
ncbi:superoxide dismutase family protein [Streptomyces sp. I05A-00742]|uniref:superoxide dismutase family protein n=1 Tax=Streptomyces sp. I05A-00742 TaxID=2732853 RepID=UPI001489F2F6|nr:superoxide dismutase family protein [Streptomyces sp. I05A-00742]